MPATPQRVVITGAEGVVGTVLRLGLAGTFGLKLLTRTVQPFESAVMDLADLPSLKAAFAGSNAVIHLAAAATLTASWEEVLASNIVGTRNVFEAAVQSGVPTVVFASSGHVIGLAEERVGAALYALDDTRQFDESTPSEPDSLYAVSKLCGETLGRHYAHRHGLRVLCLRLGTVLPDDDPRSARAGKGRSADLPQEERFPRIRAKWLSHRDCCQLFRRSIEAEPVRYALVFGTSNNPRQIWSLRRARELLGYAPEDSAPSSLE
jgi:NAD+ dependent glucose-6-phosphate dehydrogenase